MTTRDVGPPITDLGPLSCDECPVDDRSYDDNGRVCARGWREFNDAPHAVFDEVYPGWRQLPRRRCRETGRLIVPLPPEWRADVGPKRVAPEKRKARPLRGPESVTAVAPVVPRQTWLEFDSW